jgi:hypothetical protein
VATVFTTSTTQTGPSLEPKLIWNDTFEQQRASVIDEMQMMQGQWLRKVEEGCAQARVGLAPGRVY